MRVKKIHRLLRILFVLGAASVLLACPGESSSDDGTTGSTSTDISTLTLSYANVTGLQNTQIQEASPEWEGGGIPKVVYTIDPTLPDGLTIDETTGKISGTPTAVQEAISYTVTATGVALSYTGTTTATLSISVVADKISLDTFDIFSYATIEGIANVALTATGPTWGDADTPTATYAVDPALPDGLTIDETTGQISGTPTAAQTAQDYTVTATGTVAYKDTKTATISITIQEQISLDTFDTFSYAAIEGIANVALTVTGPTWGDADTPTATYAVNPALPDGLTIDETTGEISGTPTTAQAAQDYTVTATGTVAYKGTKTATVSITIQARINLNTLTFSYAAIEGIENVALTATGPTWGDDAAPIVTYAVNPALPDGLTINETTGEISGTPTAAQAAQDYTVTATGVAPLYTGTQTATVSITIQEQISLDNLAFSYATIEGIANVALTATSPTWADVAAPTVTYAVDPALPAGLTIDADSGVISGTPTAAQTAQNYTVTATGVEPSYIGTNTATVSITVQEQINVNTFTFSYADINAVDSVAITATSPTWADDAAPIVTYTVDPTLPNGLTIDETTGEISGTPTAVQEAQDYTVTATGNGELFIGTQTATVTIVVSVNLDKIFARWKESDSYKAITQTTTGTAIATVDELKNIQNNLAGTYYLTSNIDVSGVAWEPLGSIGTHFTGTFNGNGYIVHGLTIEAVSTDTDQGRYQGLFAAVSSNATIKDVGIGVTSVSAVGIAGALIGEARDTSEIDNVAVARMTDTAEITISDVMVGGLVGNIIHTAKITNAYNLEMVVKSTRADGDTSYVGGLVGQATGNTIHGYTFTGDDNTKTILSGRGAIGGLVGGSTGDMKIRGYVSGKGELKGINNIGGLAGQIGDGSIIQGYFDGGTITDIISSTVTVGGIGGLVGGGSGGLPARITISGYVANATITGVEIVGGLAGRVSTGVVTGYVVDSTITGTGTAESDSVGGLVGWIYSDKNTAINGYVVGGSISGVRRAGGLIGTFFTNTTLEGNGKIGGYVATRVTTTNADPSLARAFVSFNASSVGVSGGYWDKNAVGDITEPYGSIAISDIANIVYDGTTGAYTDSGNGDAVVFDNADFLNQFSLPEASAQRPDLRLYRVLPYGITLSADVNLEAVSSWDVDTVTWSSSNTAIVTVDENGVLKRRGAGSTTITATWGSGDTATVSVTVQ